MDIIKYNQSLNIIPTECLHTSGKKEHIQTIYTISDCTKKANGVARKGDFEYQNHVCR